MEGNAIPIGAGVIWLLGILVFLAIIILPSIRRIGPTEVGLVTKKFSRKKLPLDNPIAFDGEAGYQADYLLAGWRFKFWILYQVEKHPWPEVPPGQIGLVIAQVGAQLPTGAKSAVYKPEFGLFTNLKKFVQNGGQKGIQREVLPPGTIIPVHPVGFLVITKQRVYGVPVSPELQRKGTLTPADFGLQPDQLDVKVIKPPTSGKDKIGIVTTLEGEPLPPSDIACRLGGFADIAPIEEKQAREKEEALKILSLDEENLEKLSKELEDEVKKIPETFKEKQEQERKTTLEALEKRHALEKEKALEGIVAPEEKKAVEQTIDKRHVQEREDAIKALERRQALERKIALEAIERKQDLIALKKKQAAENEDIPNKEKDLEKRHELEKKSVLEALEKRHALEKEKALEGIEAPEERKTIEQTIDKQQKQEKEDTLEALEKKYSEIKKDTIDSLGKKQVIEREEALRRVEEPYDAQMIEIVLGSKNTLHNNYQNFQAFLDNGGKIGLQHDPLLYGAYNLNPFLVSVESVDMLVVEQGEVAVVKSYVGLPTEDTSGAEFKFGSLVRPGHRGIWRIPLRTGKYPINIRCYEAQIVQTYILNLNWAEASSKAHNLDKDLTAIKAKSREGFDFTIDLQVQIHIPDTKAPRVISIVGSMLNLVTEVLQPAVGNHFRDKIQGLPAVKFIETRKEVQEEAFRHIEEKLKLYEVETKGVYIQDVILPEQLTEVLKNKELARQKIEQYKQEKMAEDQRKLKENSQELATMQAKLVQAQVNVDIKENYAEARKKEGEGDASYIEQTGKAAGAKVKAIGLARAEAFAGQVKELGKNQTALVNIITALAEGGLKFVPNNLVLNTGGSGGSGAMDGTLLALMNFLSGLGKPETERKPELKKEETVEKKEEKTEQKPEEPDSTQKK